jgi:hypothetical protein
MGKFDSFFESHFGIIFAEYKKENNVIQSPVYSIVIRNTMHDTCSLHLYYYAFLALKTLKFQEKRDKLLIFHAKKLLF